MSKDVMNINDRVLEMFNILEGEYGKDVLSSLSKASGKWIATHPEGSYSEWTRAMSLEALNNLDESEGFWTYVASKIYLKNLYVEQENLRGCNVYSNFKDNVNKLVEKGLYSDVLTKKYSDKELTSIGKMIDGEKDNLFTYIGLKTLVDRYVACDFDKTVVELPQERWMIIAMVIMQNETVNRLDKIKESYWALSNLFMTVATPTLSNAGKPHGQLSSCFIDTVDDSLQGIYNSNTDIANLSKFGGGIGIV